MIDLEVVSPPHRSQCGGDHVFGDVPHALARRTHEVVVVVGVAGDVRRDVARPLEPRGHAIPDLGFEGAIDRGSADPRVRTADALVQLLRADGAAGASERLRDEDALRREAAPMLDEASPRPRARSHEAMIQAQLTMRLILI